MNKPDYEQMGTDILLRAQTEEVPERDVFAAMFLLCDAVIRITSAYAQAALKLSAQLKETWKEKNT